MMRVKKYVGICKDDQLVSSILNEKYMDFKLHTLRPCVLSKEINKISNKLNYFFNFKKEVVLLYLIQLKLNINYLNR